MHGQLSYGSSSQSDLTYHDREASTALGNDLMALVGQIGNANRRSTLSGGSRHCVEDAVKELEVGGGRIPDIELENTRAAIKSSSWIVWEKTETGSTRSRSSCLGWRCLDCGVDKGGALHKSTSKVNGSQGNEGMPWRTTPNFVPWGPVCHSLNCQWLAGRGFYSGTASGTLSGQSPIVCRCGFWLAKATDTDMGKHGPSPFLPLLSPQRPMNNGRDTNGCTLDTVGLVLELGINYLPAPPCSTGILPITIAMTH